MALLDQAALEFTQKILEDPPEVKSIHMDWGCFAKQGIFSSDDKSPSNPEISRLSSIFETIWFPKFKAVYEEADSQYCGSAIMSSKVISIFDA